VTARLNDRPLLELGSAAEWHEWLAANHATSSGVWLTIGKKGHSATTLTYDQAVEEALCWGWIDSTTRRLDAGRYQQSFTPRKPGGTWSAPNKKRVERLIAEGRMQPAGMAAIDAARANGSWTLLEEVEALLIPGDLARALAASPAAARGFEALGDSAKKMILYWIATAKRPETREKRIAATLDASAQGRSPV